MLFLCVFFIRENVDQNAFKRAAKLREGLRDTTNAIIFIIIVVIILLLL